MSNDPGTETKTCPKCAETIKAKAIVCRYCGADLSSTGDVSAAERLKNVKLNVDVKQRKQEQNQKGIGCIVVLGVLGLLYAIGNNSGDNREPDYSSAQISSSTPVERPPALVGAALRKAAESEIGGIKDAIKPAAESVSDLKVKNWHWGEEYSHAIAEGTVTNQTSQSIDNLVAVVTFSDSSGNFITSEDALIDFRPLLPGQTSPFKVIASYNPAMQTANLSFRTFDGQAVGHDEGRKIKNDEAAARQYRLVEIIQGDLIFLGYMKGFVDGKMGSGTREAIRAFQKAYDLPINGEPSVEVAATTHAASKRQPLTSDKQTPK